MDESPLFMNFGVSIIMSEEVSTSVSLTVVQSLGLNHPQTAAMPPPALGSTSSHTWRKSKIRQQHVVTALKEQLGILILVKPVSALRRRSLSQHFCKQIGSAGGSTGVTPSALSCILTVTKIRLWTRQVICKHAVVFISAASLEHKHTLIWDKSPARRTQQASLNLSFEVPLKSMPGHWSEAVWGDMGGTVSLWGQWRSSLCDYRPAGLMMCHQTENHPLLSPTGPSDLLLMKNIVIKTCLPVYEGCHIITIISDVIVNIC